MAHTQYKIPRGKQYNTYVTVIGEETHVQLYGTVICKYNRSAGTAVLNTGGLNTATTIRRMNSCLSEFGFTSRVCRGSFSDGTVLRISGGNVENIEDYKGKGTV